jgi:hypothetical protein
MRRLLLGAGILALLVAGCAGAAHLKALQPPTVPTSPAITVPAAAASRPPWPGRFPQLGIDIDLYTYPGQDFAAAAATDVSYIASLHANAVSVSFPFFMSGPDAAGVYASDATPTPSQLAVLVRDSEQAGLYVSIRPLLDEGNLGRARSSWVPADPAAWFAGYQHFLEPYAAMAQAQHVQEFIVGSEFDRFSRSPRWDALDRALRDHFRGILACANNSARTVVAGNCGGGVTETVDAYHSQLGNLLTGWEAFDRQLPRDTVETEVGIAAVNGAYKTPYQHQWRTRSLDQSVQARWFTASCRAAAKTHLGGIYFWPLNFSQTLGSGPTLAEQGRWAGGKGARAIAACFAAVERTDR